MADSEEIAKVVSEHEDSGRYLMIEGIKTFALDYGSGEAVVCIHGVPTSSFLYRKVLTSLASKGYRGISIDLPGLGLSARPEDFDYSFPNFADFLASALKEMQIDEFHLVVHDIGGPIGFSLAARNLEKIKSLTILDTWIDVVNFKKPLPMRPFEKNVLGEAELKMMTHTTWPLVFSGLGVKNTDKIPDAEIKAYVDILKREDDGKAFLKIMRNFTDSEEFKEQCLKAVKNPPYPVQAIWGEDDPGLTIERYGEEIKEAANLEELQLLPAKHFLQEEVWEEIATKIVTLAESS